MSPSPSACPKCKVVSPCVDWNEVDIGVGVQTFDYEYKCPEHGCFADAINPLTYESHYIFRDEQAP